jgi:DNA-binding NarL/FixJ family response regulator
LKNATVPTVGIRTLIVEDQGMFRAFLERWLAQQSRFVVVGVAASGEDALAAVAEHAPDVMIVDLQLPGMDGLACVRAARQVRPQLRALVLSSLVDVLALTRVRESGVEGYLEKDARPEQLAEALHSVADGRPYFSSRFGETLAREKAKALAVGKILSRREQEILSHVLAGKTSREVSDVIGLSVRTVEFHRANIMGKLGATNRTEAVALAAQKGLITLHA